MFNTQDHTSSLTDQSQINLCDNLCECKKKKLFEELKRIYSNESNIELDSNFRNQFDRRYNDLGY